MIYVLLLSFFVLEYVRPTSYLPALLPLHLNSVVPLSAFVGTLLASRAGAAYRVFAEPSTRIIVGLQLLVWLSVLTADVQQFAYDASTILIGFVLIYWVMACEVTTVSRVKGVIKALILVHVFVAALNPLLFTDPATRHYIRSGAFLGDGNDFALSLNIIIPLCIFLALDSRRIVYRIFWGSALFVLVAGIVATQSRGGTIGLLAMGIYYWTKTTRKLPIAAVGVAVVVFILALAPGAYFDRISSIGDTQEGSAQGRLTAWKVAVQMAIDNPLLGVGAANFPTKFGYEYRPEGFVGSGMTAHSIYFLALGELGIPGLILVVSLIASNLSANRRLAKEVRARNTATRDSDLQLLASGSAAMIALASAGAFLSALYYPHLYVVAGLLTGMRHVVRSHCEAAAQVPVSGPPPRQVSVHWALRPPAPTRGLHPAGGRR